MCSAISMVSYVPNEESKNAQEEVDRHLYKTVACVLYCNALREDKSQQRNSGADQRKHQKRLRSLHLRNESEEELNHTNGITDVAQYRSSGTCLGSLSTDQIDDYSRGKEEVERSLVARGGVHANNRNERYKTHEHQRLNCLAVQQETDNAEDTNNPGRGEDTLITLCIGKESAPARCVGNAISDVSSVEGIKESKEGEEYADACVNCRQPLYLASGLVKSFLRPGDSRGALHLLGLFSGSRSGTSNSLLQTRNKYVGRNQVNNQNRDEEDTGEPRAVIRVHDEGENGCNRVDACLGVVIRRAVQPGEQNGVHRHDRKGNTCIRVAQIVGKEENGDGSSRDENTGRINKTFADTLRGSIRGKVQNQTQNSGNGSQRNEIPNERQSRHLRSCQRVRNDERNQQVRHHTVTHEGAGSNNSCSANQRREEPDVASFSPNLEDIDSNAGQRNKRKTRCCKRVGGNTQALYETVGEQTGSVEDDCSKRHCEDTEDSRFILRRRHRGDKKTRSTDEQERTDVQNNIEEDILIDPASLRRRLRIRTR